MKCTRVNKDRGVSSHWCPVLPLMVGHINFYHAPFYCLPAFFKSVSLHVKLTIFYILHSLWQIVHLSDLLSSWLMMACHSQRSLLVGSVCVCVLIRDDLLFLTAQTVINS